MKKARIPLFILLGALLVLPSLSGSKEEQPAAKRPLEDIKDILAWKSIRSPVISRDGRWFAYRLSPQEGDGEVVVRNTSSEKEFKFPAGESPGSSDDIRFSSDSKWVAFTIYPSREEARKLKKEKKKAYHKAGLLNLISGEKNEFDKVEKFAFSGEASTWLALQKYGPETQGPSSPESQEKSQPDKWRGADLLLYELGTGKELTIGNVAEFAFDKKGLWLAWVVDTQDRTGNGIQARDMKSGVIHVLDSDKAIYKKLTWTEEGTGLAAVKGKDDDNYEDKLYSLVGFTGFGAASPSKITYDPKEDKTFPEGMTISPNRSPLWTDDLEGILFGIHEVKKKEKKQAEKEEIKEKKTGPESPAKQEKIDKEDLPELVIWHWKDRRLQSMQQVQEQRDKEFSYLCIFRVKEKKFIRLADEQVREVSAAPKHRWAIGIDRQPYEWMGNLDGRQYQDIYVVDLRTGERKRALEKCRWYFGPSPDGTHFLYYENGHYHTFEMATGKSFNITKDVPTSFINKEDDHNVVDPPILPYFYGWTKTGTSVLLYDNWDVWQIPVHGGKGVNLTLDGREKGLRYRWRYRLDPEEKGIDLTKPIYIEAYGERNKKGGIARLVKGKPGVEMLLWDDAAFSLLKAEKAEVYLYARQTYQDFPDYYVTDASFRNGKRLTEANPQQKDFLWSSGTMLLDYTSDKGDKLQAALFLPANYEPGKKYPTIVYIYEKLSQSLNAYTIPSARGFNKSVYTSRGYAVLMPDIVYKVNDPGLSAVWCVLPALKAAIDTGVVDPERVGLHGHSWGGYETSFLITQTDAFRAAVAGAPLTNLISMYSSIYWNTGSANQPIFESSQGRFQGGYWENIEAYTRNSPVYHAQKVKTPLLLLHNDKDGAVDWNQGIEYFNTLRRLGKPVAMLQYKGENHSLRKPANQKDYTIRMREFFDHYLMGKPAPQWLEEGVPHLMLEKHLEERTREILKR